MVLNTTYYFFLFLNPVLYLMATVTLIFMNLLSKYKNAFFKLNYVNL